MKTYIVRIYRYESSQPKDLLGVIEEIGVEGQKAFTNLAELWQILKYPSKAHPKETKEFPVPDEKRQHIRNPFVRGVEYSMPSIANEIQEGIIVDMSNCGMCILTKKPFKKKDRIHIQGDIPSPSAKAIVRWSLPLQSLYRSGLELMPE